MKKLFFPLTDRQILDSLEAGESVLVSGTVYTARDAAHKRLTALLDEGKPLPLPLDGQAIYYTGPCPAPEGRPIGSCGPTTSGRMDAYAPRLIALGQSAMIGKGERSAEVVEACRTFHAVYLAAAGGAGALMADCVRACEVVAFPELLSEAIHKLTVENMPLIVAIDTRGNDIFSRGRALYAGKGFS